LLLSVRRVAAAFWRVSGSADGAERVTVVKDKERARIFSYFYMARCINLNGRSIADLID